MEWQLNGAAVTSSPSGPDSSAPRTGGAGENDGREGGGEKEEELALGEEKTREAEEEVERKKAEVLRRDETIGGG